MKKRESKLTEGKLIDFIRKEGRTILPPWGSWVTIVGNPYAPRGLRIPESIHELGVHHLDIYYAYDEGCPWTLHGDDSLLYKFNTEELAKAKDNIHSRIAQVQDTSETIQKLNEYAIKTIAMAVERNALLGIAVDKLDYIASGNVSKSHAVSIAKSGLDEIKAKMEEYETIKDNNSDGTPSTPAVVESSGPGV